MPDVGVQGKHEIIDIPTLLTPAFNPSANKREAQIVNARSAMAAATAPTQLEAQSIERAAHSVYVQTTTAVREEEQ